MKNFFQMNGTLKQGSYAVIEREVDNDGVKMSHQEIIEHEGKQDEAPFYFDALAKQEGFKIIKIGKYTA